MGRMIGEQVDKSSRRSIEETGLRQLNTTTTSRGDIDMVNINSSLFANAPLASPNFNMEAFSTTGSTKPDFYFICRKYTFFEVHTSVDDSDHNERWMTTECNLQ
eukprot:g5057.t1 g5057   contig18:534369-534767(-)